MVSAKKKMNVDVSTASEKTSWSYVKLESKADVEATKIPVPESEFVVPKFIARECEDNVTITYQINGGTESATTKGRLCKIIVYIKFIKSSLYLV